MKELLLKLKNSENLSFEESKSAFQIIMEGKTSENEIYDYLKNQYGEWITYDPEFNKKTFILWGLPVLLFFLGGAIILKKLVFRKV